MDMEQRTRLWGLEQAVWWSWRLKAFISLQTCLESRDQSPETDKRRGRRAVLFLHSCTLLIGTLHSFVIFHALFIRWVWNKQKAASTSFIHFLTGSLGSEQRTKCGRESMVCQKTSTRYSVSRLTELKELTEDTLVSRWCSLSKASFIDMITVWLIHNII